MDALCLFTAFTLPFTNIYYTQDEKIIVKMTLWQKFAKATG